MTTCANGSPAPSGSARSAHVKGASWQEDIGLAAEAILREENGPCVVFDEVPGCPKGFRVLLNMFAGIRRNMTLGFPDHLTKWELSDAYPRGLSARTRSSIPHEIVDDGPVFENIMIGDDIDVTKFPSPIWHEKDGGRYIGTGTYSITRDPEENWLNAGAYRAMVHDKNSVGMLMAPAITAASTATSISSAASRCRSCMVLGGDPLCFFYGGLEAPYGVFEIDVVGGLRGRPMQDGARQGHRPAVSRPTPRSCWKATSRRTSALVEGPFGEWTGHYAGGAKPCTGARHQGDLSPQRSDPARRAADGRRARRDGALPRGDALGHHQAEHRPTPACPACSRCGATRSAARACSTASRSSSAIPATPCRPATSPRNAAPRPMPRNTSWWCDDDVDVTNLDHLLWAMLTRTDPEGIDPVHRGLVGFAGRSARCRRRSAPRAT